MSTAASEISDVHSPAAEVTAEVAPHNGQELPVPAQEPMGGTIAFLLATMGSVALVFAISFAIVSIGRGGSISLWSTGISTMAVVWLAGIAAALWSSETRGEWG